MLEHTLTFKSKPGTASDFLLFSVDWMLSLIARRPELLTAGVLEQLLQLWQLLSPVQLLSVVSPSTLMLLAHAKDTELSWQKMRLVVGRLLEENLLPALGLEDSCLALLHQEWPAGVLEGVGRCLEGLQQEREWEGALDWVPWFIKTAQQVE